MMMLPFISTEQAHKLHDENVKWAYSKMLFDEIGIETFLWITNLSDIELIKLSDLIKKEINQRDLSE
jgi:hypothetical protein